MATMKIGIPIAGDETSLDNVLAPGFHACKYFGIYDLQNDTVEVLSIDSAKTGFIKLLHDKDIKAVISPSFQILSIRLFRENFIDIYKAESLDVSENIDCLKHNLLNKFSFWDMNDENNCKSGCSACISPCKS